MCCQQLLCFLLCGLLEESISVILEHAFGAPFLGGLVIWSLRTLLPAALSFIFYLKTADLIAEKLGIARNQYDDYYFKSAVAALIISVYVYITLFILQDPNRPIGAEYSFFLTVCLLLLSIKRFAAMKIFAIACGQQLICFLAGFLVSLIIDSGISALFPPLASSPFPIIVTVLVMTVVLALLFYFKTADRIAWRLGLDRKQYTRRHLKSTVILFILSVIITPPLVLILIMGANSIPIPSRYLLSFGVTGCPCLLTYLIILSIAKRKFSQKQ